MAKTAAISVRVPESTKEALELAARADGRSLASLVERILSQWLQSNASSGSQGSGQ